MRNFPLPINCLLLFIICTGCASNTPQLSDKQSAQTQLPKLVDARGVYATIPLEKDEVVVKVIQSEVRNLQSFSDVEEGLAKNLQTMEEFAKRACGTGKKPDFLLYNEFPLTGYSSGSRDEKLKFTITVPGPETDALGEIAKSCDTYIIFGSYATDPGWPGHILSLNTVIGRDGAIKEKFWKTRNVKRLGKGEIPTTTIENVYDRYLNAYGPEALYPVVRTEYGNIAVSTVQLDAFVYAAFAMRGVEIMFRTSTLFAVEDVKAIARFNDFYSAMSNIVFPEESGAAQYGGDSLIVSPDGDVLGELPGNIEGIIEGTIPIRAFRENRRIPRFPMEVVQPVFQQYRQEVPLNHLDLPVESLPQTRETMKELLDNESRWLNND